MRQTVTIVLALACASATPAFAQGAADARLDALLDAEWTWRTNELLLDPEGSNRPVTGMPHVDAASQQRRRAYWSAALAKLDAIPADQLSNEASINASVFRTALTAYVNQIRFGEYEEAFGFWTWLAPRQGFAKAEDYRNYLSRLRDMPRYVDEQIVNMRAGLKRGFMPAKPAVAGRDRTVEPLASTAVEQNPFYTAFTQMPGSIPPAEQERLRAEARTLIAGQVAPAYAKLLAFLRTDYMPRARDNIAAESLPDGKAYYAAKVKEFTTLDLTPEQIHAIGLKEVARIDADMQATMKAAGWKGDFAGFLHFLKTDPQFTAKTPYQLLAHSAYIANKANGKLNETIGLLPRYRFTILPTPANIAPFSTGGGGGLDSCVMNTYNLPARPLYTINPLTLHECVPGHSLQAALALEGPNRPPIRRTTYFSGYGEGWGLYTEWLGIGWGIYETPYEEFGRETYEMWRAARLVIDTGIHHMGWSRQQALDYLSSHTALSDHEVTIEVDRYIKDAGQALAYKLGEMTIRRKRAEAEAKLGERFDQRWFHDVVLGLGSVPLPVLEQHIDLWIAGGGKNPNAAPES